MNIEKICSNVFHENNDFKYIKDAADYWKTPTEFIKDGGGDCEDWCIWWRSRLLAEGVPESNIFMAWVPWTPHESHIFLMVKDGETYWVLNVLSYDICAVEWRDMIELYGPGGIRWRTFNGQTTNIPQWEDCKKRMEES